ncbi:MAG: hypothetical protein IT233_09225 [Bacteroidia bacterium]|nr:hypothetical protein [Bacteroidia bacterium]
MSKSSSILNARMDVLEKQLFPILAEARKLYEQIKLIDIKKLNAPNVKIATIQDEISALELKMKQIKEKADPIEWEVNDIKQRAMNIESRIKTLLFRIARARKHTHTILLKVMGMEKRMKSVRQKLSTAAPGSSLIQHYKFSVSR